ncbi:Peptidase inhibitor 16 [Orchesella cincta]|uniref:Peptidase inhibitor 16 n=1 Tax=Orchesella cincta TaxID=48709 RepID=A0A1D2MZZ0_ORCCI|nr:Peptidase inhibitor 16 [Orchesella cincta]
MLQEPKGMMRLLETVTFNLAEDKSWIVLEITMYATHMHAQKVLTREGRFMISLSSLVPIQRAKDIPVMALTTEERKALILKIGLGLLIAGMLVSYTYVWIQWVDFEGKLPSFTTTIFAPDTGVPLKRNIDLDMLALMCAEYYRPRGGVDHTCPYIKQGYNYYFKEAVTDNGLKVGPFADYSNRWSHMEVAVAGSYAFYNERENYNFSDFKTCLNTSFGSVGHFTEVLWRGVEEFGFASAVYPKGKEYANLGVFLYHPGGNVMTDDKAYFIMNVRPALKGTPPLEPLNWD